MCPSRRQVELRRGLTLVEVLVVVFVIGALVSLAMPALQQGREAASRISCVNHLRQIGIALHKHHDSFDALPGNGGWDASQQIIGVDGKVTYISSTDDKNINGPQQYLWGVGDPTRTGPEQPGSWAFSILPQIEQAAIFQHRDWRVGIPLYVCSSRRTAVGTMAPLIDEYGSYVTGGWTWGKVDYAANALVVPNRPRVVRIGDIRDGTSHTLLVGEKSMDPKNCVSGTWYFDEPFFAGGSAGTARSGAKVLRDSAAVNFQNNWGSSHSGVCNALFCDGHVGGLMFSTEETIVQALLTPHGRDLVPEL